MKLKKESRYDYIHKSYFPGQGSDFAYIFKMSTIERGSGMDLVHWMQKDGNLQFEFIMVDHVKRISFWTTLETHVNNHIHCKVMTICCYDMKLEIDEYQMKMWLSLIVVIEKHGMKDVNFAKFMVDSAQANFNAICEVFRVWR